jgi:hypothetical protein
VESSGPDLRDTTLSIPESFGLNFSDFEPVTATPSVSLSQEGLGVILIAGIAGGGLALIAIVVVAAVYATRCRPKREKSKKSSSSQGHIITETLIEGDGVGSDLMMESTIEGIVHYSPKPMRGPGAAVWDFSDD